MGNVLTAGFEDEPADEIWAAQDITGKILFDRAFLNNACRQLTVLDPATMVKAQESVDTKVKSDVVLVSDPMTNVVDNSMQSIKPLEYFSALKPDAAVLSATEQTDINQVRLARRVQLALLRQTQNVGGLKQQAETDDELGEQAGQTTEAIVLAVSTRMSYDIMCTMGPKEPVLLEKMCRGIMSVITAQQPMCLQELETGRHPALRQIFDELQDFLFQQFEGGTKGSGYMSSLLASLAVERASIPDVLRLADLLASGKGIPLDSDKMIKRLHDACPPTSLTTVSECLQKTPKITASCVLPKPDGDEAKGKEPAPTAGVRIVASADGHHVFMYHSATGKVYKVGTGSSTTVAGFVYTTSDCIMDKIEELDDPTGAKRKAKEAKKAKKLAALAIQQAQTRKTSSKGAEDAEQSDDGGKPADGGDDKKDGKEGDKERAAEPGSEIDPASILLQFEGRGSDNIKESDNLDPSGDAGYAVYAFTTESAGIAKLTVAYGSGDAEAKALNLTLNGEVIADGACAEAGNDKHQTFDVILTRGENILRIQADKGFPATLGAITVHDLVASDDDEGAYVPDMYMVPYTVDGETFMGIGLAFQENCVTLDSKDLQIVGKPEELFHLDEQPDASDETSEDPSPRLVHAGRYLLKVSAKDDRAVVTLLDPQRTLQTSVSTIELRMPKSFEMSAAKLRTTMISTNGDEIVMDDRAKTYRFSLRTGKLLSTDTTDYSSEAPPAANCYSHAQNCVWTVKFDSETDVVVKMNLSKFSNGGLRPYFDPLWPLEEDGTYLSQSPNIRLHGLSNFKMDGIHPQPESPEAMTASWQAIQIMTQMERLNLPFKKPDGSFIQQLMKTYDEEDISNIMCLDCSAQTVNRLFSMIYDRKDLLEEFVSVAEQESYVKQGNFSAMMMMSSMSMLSTVIFQLVRQGAKMDYASGALSKLDKQAVKELREILVNYFDKAEKDFMENPLALKALNFFVESLDLFYPSLSDQSVLLMDLLNQQRNGDLSAPEGKVLELLLKQMSEPNRISSFLAELQQQMAEPDASSPMMSRSMSSPGGQEPQEEDSNTSISLLKSSLHLTFVEIKKEKGKITALGNSARELALALTKFLISQSVQTIVTASDLSSKAVANASHVITNILQAALSVCQMNPFEGEAGALDRDSEFAVEMSPIYSLFPLLLLTLKHLLADYDEAFQREMKAVSRHLADITNIVTNVRTQLPVDRLEMQVEGGATGGGDELEIESPHPYENSANVFESYSLPGAERLTITFDEQCRVENGCDYLIFWGEEGKEHNLLAGVEGYSEGKAMGRDSTRAFPGLDGKDPLEIEGDSFWIEFHSDSSVNDWGYKFKVVGQFAATSEKQMHWLVQLEHEACYVSTALARAMIRGRAIDSAVYRSCAPWMNLMNHTLNGITKQSQQAMDLIKSDLQETFSVLEDFTGDVDQLSAGNNRFLQLAAVFSTVASAASSASADPDSPPPPPSEVEGEEEEKKSDAPPNTAMAKNCAVLAVFSALVYHNHLSANLRRLHDKYLAELAPGALPPVGTDVAVEFPFLARVWKTAQKTAVSFQASELRFSMDIAMGWAHEELDALRPHAISPDQIVLHYATAVVQRAALLQTIAPQDLQLVNVLSGRSWTLASEPLAEPSSGSQEEKKSGVLDEFDQDVLDVLQSPDMIGTRAWQLRVREASMQADKDYATTLVLRFTQSTISVKDLTLMIKLVDRRADERAFGLESLCTNITSGSQDDVSDVLSNSAEVLRGIVGVSAGSVRVHPLSDLNGCSHESFTHVQQCWTQTIHDVIHALIQAVPAVILADEQRPQRVADAMAELASVSVVVKSVVPTFNNDTSDEEGIRLSVAFNTVRGEKEKQIKNGDGSGEEQEPFVLRDSEYIVKVNGHNLNGKCVRLQFETNLGRSSDEFGLDSAAAKTAGARQFQLEAGPGKMVTALKGSPDIEDIIQGICPFDEAVLHLDTPSCNDIALGALRMMTCDFEPTDFAVFAQSTLLSVVEQLCYRTVNDELTAAAWDFLGVLVSRTFVAMQRCPSDPVIQAFTGTLLQSLSDQLKAELEALCKAQAVSALAKPPTMSGVDGASTLVVLPGLCNGSDGLTAPHAPVLEKYSASVWIRPARGAEGVIWRKGGARLLDEEEQEPGALLELLLVGGKLEFRKATGDGAFLTLQGRHPVTPDKWHHVVVAVGDQSSVYLDGELDAQPVIGSSMTIESPHDYNPNMNVDYPVDIPGALDITVTFDEQSDTEKNYDFCKFIKPGTTDTFGGDGDGKISGRRSASDCNWPGVNGVPPLVIPGSSFVCHFTSDGSNQYWGFKFEAEPRFPPKASGEDDKPADPLKNQAPFYIGTPPTHAANDTGMAGGIASLAFFNDCEATIEQVSAMFEAGVPLSSDSPDLTTSDERAVNLLALLQQPAKLVAPGLLQGAGLLEPLVGFANMGSGRAQSAAKAMFSTLVPDPTSPQLLAMAAKPDVKAFECGNGYVRGLLQHIGAGLSAWMCPPHPGMVKPNDSLQRVRSWLELLVTLVGEGGQWRDEVVACIKESTAAAASGSLLEAFPDSHGEEERIDAVPPAYALLLGCLALVGGSPAGAFPGARVLVTLNGIDELATVVSVTTPPAKPEDGDKEATAAWEAQWGDVDGRGDVLAVLVDSRPDSAQLAKRSAVRLLSDGLPTEALAAFASGELSDALVEAVKTVVGTPALQPKPTEKYEPLVEIRDYEHVYNTPHDYDNGMDESTTIEFEHAEEMTIEFDPQCETEDMEDFLRFFKDEAQTETLLEPFYGPPGAERWPAKVIIPEGKVVVLFHSDSAGNAWGVKFTARAKGRFVCEPPELPPTAQLKAATFLQWHAVRAASKLLQGANGNAALASQALPLMPQLIDMSQGGSLAAEPLPPLPVQTFESNHPYDHSVDIDTPVSCPGASKLIVTFSQDTKCESGNCDYMMFFKDEGKSEKIGEEKYNGGRDGSQHNWPGVGDNPPLEIEGDFFVFRWKTDGSVNDWGYLMTVTPIRAGSGGDSSEVSRLGGELAISQLVETLAEGRPSEPVPDCTKFKVVAAKEAAADEVAEFDFSHAFGSSGDGAEEDSATPQEKVEKEYGERFFINPKAGQYALKQSADEEAEAVDRCPELNCCHSFAIVEKNEDAKMMKITAFGLMADEDVEGWIPSAHDDYKLYYPVSYAKMARLEEEAKAEGRLPAELTAQPKEELELEMVDLPELSAVAGNTEQAVLPPPSAHVQGVTSSLNSALQSKLQTAVKTEASMALLTLLRSWPADTPLTAATLGGESQLLHTVKLLRNIDEAVVSTALQRCMAADPELVQRVMRTALGELQKAIKASDSGPAKDKPVGPRMVITKELESPHNYQDNMDTWDTVHVPGASYLEISFDPQTATENGCDYLQIFQGIDKRDTPVGPGNLTGRVGSNNFPGIGNNAKLRVEGSACEFHFHSDGSNTDWGYKANISAVFELPSEVAAARAAKAEAEAAPAQEDGPALEPADIEFAAFLLNKLSHEPGETAQQLLLSPLSLSLLLTYLEAAATPAESVWVLHLLTNMMQPLLKDDASSSMDEKGAEQLKQVIECVHGRFKKHCELEANESEKTPLLKALMQTATVLQRVLSVINKGLVQQGSQRILTVAEQDAADDLAAVQRNLVWNLRDRAPGIQLKAARAVAARSVDGGEDTAAVALGDVEFSQGVCRWNVVLQQSTGAGLRIGIAPKLDLASKPEGEGGEEEAKGGEGEDGEASAVDLFGKFFTSELGTEAGIGWGESSLRAYDDTRQSSSRHDYGVDLKSGDVVTVELDMSQETLRFYRNTVDLGLAVGPRGSDAPCEMSLLAISKVWVPAISLTQSSEEVLITEAPAKLHDHSADNIVAKSIEARALMTKLVAGTLPDSFMLDHVLPELAAKQAVPMQVSTRASYSETFKIEGATALRVVFGKSTKLIGSDGLEVTSTAAGESISMSGVAVLPSPDQTVTEGAFGIMVGDLVVRGPDWDSDNEDGGKGCKGSVTEIDEEARRASVNWNDAGSGQYRWSDEGHFDLAVVNKDAVAGGTTASATGAVHLVKGVIEVAGDEVTVALTAGDTPNTLGGMWKLDATVVPVYGSAECLSLFPDAVAEAAVVYEFTPSQDRALVRYVDEISEKRSMNLQKVAWSAIAPAKSEDLVTYPELAEVLDRAFEGFSLSPVQARFGVFQRLNSILATLLPFIDLKLTDKPWSMASLIVRCRSMLFGMLKLPVLDRGLAYTQSSAGPADLALDWARKEAFLASPLSAKDELGSETIFSQLFRATAGWDLQAWRQCDTALFNVLESDKSATAVLEEVVQELHSTVLPLFVRSPNGQLAIGVNRGSFVPNPKATSALQKEQFVFVGKLIGQSARRATPFAINLAPVVWEALVAEESFEPISSIDASLDKYLSEVLSITDADHTDALFEAVVSNAFQTLSTDGQIVQLPSSGEAKVTFASRSEFVALAKAHRLNEYAKQIAWIRAGLRAVVPTSLLSLLTGSDLEWRANPALPLNLKLLKQHTEYHGSGAQEAAKKFWGVLAEFSPAEGVKFLQYVSGRSRLAVTAANFTQKFKLCIDDVGVALDMDPPVARPSRFQLTLPKYSSQDVLKTHLLQAMFQDVEIDEVDVADTCEALSLTWAD